MMLPAFLAGFALMCTHRVRDHPTNRRRRNLDSRGQIKTQSLYPPLLGFFSSVLTPLGEILHLKSSAAEPAVLQNQNNPPCRLHQLWQNLNIFCALWNPRQWFLQHQNRTVCAFQLFCVHCGAVRCVIKGFACLEENSGASTSQLCFWQRILTNSDKGCV